MVALGLVVTACGTAQAQDLTKPSVSAKMICGAEAQKDLAADLNIKPIRVTSPTWKDHVYSCSYMYKSGVVRLSVKELSNATATRSYFDGLATRLGKRSDPLSLGQGSFFTADGSVIVRKDFKVLEVDVSALPVKFTRANLSRSDTAVNFAVTIMGCWTGK